VSTPERIEYGPHELQYGLLHRAEGAARGTVVLIHGGFWRWNPEYMDGPAGLADALAARGYEVSAPLLAGHGADVAALEATQWPDWLQSANEAFLALAARVPGRIAIVGFSMGGLLSLRLAADHSARVGGLVVMSAPINLRAGQVNGIRLLGLVPERWRRGPLRAIPKVASDVAHPDYRGKILGLPAMPVLALQALLDLMANVRNDLARVQAPTLVVHGRRDRTVPISDGELLADSLGAAPVVERLWLDESRHIVGIDVERDRLIVAIEAFLAARVDW